MGKDYTKLRELLIEQEEFPLEYLHKFIGRRTEAFARSVEGLEKAFPGLVRVSERESSDGAHRALTYRFTASDADAVISLLRATDAIADLRIVL